MADRCTLHKTMLGELKQWLTKDGWTIELPKGRYEVLRATKPNKKHPFIVYAKLETKEHYTIQDKDSAVFGAFMRDRRPALKKSEDKR